MRRLGALATAMCAFAIITTLHPSPALAYVDNAASFAAVEVHAPPPLDANVGGPVWQQGVVASNFFNYTTRAPAGPDVATTAYILYDDKNLYVGFDCVQKDVPIVAKQTTNDVGEGLDDEVAVLIDPSGNGTRGYQFITTPRGVRYQGSSESNRYNPPWQAAAATRSGGWSAMLVIPLADLRSSGGVQTWRISFQRRLAVKDELFVWAYNPKMNGPDDSTYFPALTGLHISARSTRPQPHAELFALSSTGLDRNQFQQTDGTFAYQPIRHVGADATYPLTNTLALVGTIYPDFSNVEVDQQTIAPQQFQRQFLEYRPFFAAGEPYLNPSMTYYIYNGTPNLLFYSPSIGTFNWGAKVEGTQGETAIGALAVGGPGFDDQALGLNQETPDQDFRVFFDGVAAHHTQDGTSVTPCPGTLLTCTDSTYEFGALKVDRASGWQSSFDYAAETGSYVADASLGHSFIFNVARNMPFTGFEFGYRDIGPLFSPVDGYTQLSDIRGYYADFGGQGNGTGGSIIKTYGGYVAGERYVDSQGEVHYTEASGALGLTFKDLFSIRFNPVTSELLTSSGFPDYLQPQTLPYNTSTISAGYAESSASPVTVSYSWGPFATQCQEPPSTTTPNPLFCPPFPNQYTPFYLQQFDGTIARQLTARFNVSFQLAGTDERPFAGTADGQWLRRLSLGENLGSNASISVGLRSISGNGGFSYPGSNIAASFHDRFPSGDELFIDFGSPASTVTLDRLIIKFVLHLGAGGVGT